MTVEKTYRGDIPCLVGHNTDLRRDGYLVMGYLDGDHLLSRWSWAPLCTGQVPQKSGFFYKASWIPFAEVVSSVKEFFSPRISGSLNATGEWEYKRCYDRQGRIYLLAPANGGFIPVRHGTDPLSGNWLYYRSRTRIVYDTNGMRHPACDGIDYASHGFTLEHFRDACGRTNSCWWPRANGPFDPDRSPTKLRITLPYYPSYQQILERPSSRFVKVVTAIVFAVMLFFGFASRKMALPALLSMGADAHMIVREARDQTSLDANERHYRQMLYEAQKTVIKELDDEDTGKRVQQIAEASGHDRVRSHVQDAAVRIAV